MQVLPYLAPIQRLAAEGIYFGVTNQLIAGLKATEDHFANNDIFPVLEWKTNLQSLIGEAVLVGVYGSKLRYLMVRINCSLLSLRSSIEQQHWSSFISHLQDQYERTKLVFAISKNDRCEQTTIDWLSDLRDNLYPLPLAIECEHRSWRSIQALKILRQTRLNIVQRDFPQLAGFNSRLPNFDSKWCVLRLLGRNQASWFSTDQAIKYSYDYNRQELSDLALEIRALKEEHDSIFIVAGHRPFNTALSNLIELANLYSRL